MELPAWAFEPEGRVSADGSIDMVFRLRFAGRFWLAFCALLELIRTGTITIAIRFQEGRPALFHGDDQIEPHVEEPDPDVPF
jgi:hypothetical protein